MSSRQESLGKLPPKKLNQSGNKATGQSGKYPKNKPSDSGD